LAPTYLLLDLAHDFQIEKVQEMTYYLNTVYIYTISSYVAIYDCMALHSERLEIIAAISRDTAEHPLLAIERQQMVVQPNRA